MTIIGMLAGGMAGIGLGWVLCFWIPDRRHRRATVRKWDRIVTAHRQRMEALGLKYDDE